MSRDAALARLRRDYASAFLGYLTRRDELGLRAAYELGRAAMSNSISLLDLVHVHHEVLLDVQSTAKDAAELRSIGRLAADFLVEALASFEMTQRGFMERAIDPGPRGRQPKPAAPS